MMFAAGPARRFLRLFAAGHYSTRVNISREQWHGRWEEFSSRVRRSRPVCIIPGREGRGGKFLERRSFVGKNKKP